MTGLDSSILFGIARLSFLIPRHAKTYNSVIIQVNLSMDKGLSPLQSLT